jgi:RAP1 GTPase activating protein 1
MIIEFDPETFRLLLDYLHTGSCPLTCVNIPGLICAAEHYDLPDLLQACFHHAKQFLRTEVVITLNYCIYDSIKNNHFAFCTTCSSTSDFILRTSETINHICHCANATIAILALMQNEQLLRSI